MKDRSLIFGVLILSAVFYSLPLVGLLIDDPYAATGYMYVALPIMVFPVCCFIAAITTGTLCGFAWQLPLITAALFIPAALLFYGESALPYAAVYGVVGYMGLIIAWPFSLLRRRRLEKKRCAVVEQSAGNVVNADSALRGKASRC